MSDFNFVGPEYEAASYTQDAQQLINWYPETDPNKGAVNIVSTPSRGAIALYPTPGLLLKLALPDAGPVRGMYVFPGSQILYVVSNNALYSVTTAFVATQVGTLSTGSGPVSISSNATSVYLADGIHRYYYTPATTTFAQTADGAFNNGTFVDNVDNFLIYNSPGTQQWGCTDAGSVSSSALNVSSKDGSSDNLTALIAINRDVLLLGEVTGEWWTDAGLFPFPFTRIPGTSMQHGTIAPQSLARLGESCAFLANDTRGECTVVLMAGYQPKRISTYAVESAIDSYAVINDAIGMTYTQSGHEFYMLSFPTADVTWCYDLSTQLWHKRAYRDSQNMLHRHRANCLANFNGEVIVGDFQNSNLYSFSQTVYTDNTAPIPCIRRCPHLTTDLKRQFFHDLQIQFQPGVGLQSGQGSNPQAMLRWSDDGGATWSNEHWAGIGKVGQYKRRAIWRRLGQARDRIFEVEVTDPVYRVVVSANLNASAGAS